MDKVGYEHENNTNYLTVLAQNQEASSYQLKMLVRNKIPGLLNMSIRNINNKLYYYYDITSKRQMVKLYEFGKLQWEDIAAICRSIDRVVAGVDEYMLDMDSIVIDPEYMYINVAEKEICYVYNPDNRKDFGEMLKELFEFILEHYEHGKEQNNVMKVYEIYQKITDGEYDSYHLSSLIEEPRQDNVVYFTPEKETSVVLEDIPIEKVTSETEQVQRDWILLFQGGKIILALCVIYAVAALFFPEKVWFGLGAPVCILIILAGSAAVIQLDKFQKKQERKGKVVEITEDKQYSFLKEKQQEWESKEIRDDMMQEEKTQETGNTILLSDYLKKKAGTGRLTLVLQNNEELESPYDKWIQISEFPCVIGSMTAYCNVVIQSELISRMHVCIHREQETYYLEDMNSTNGTFLNEERILPQSRHLLCHGDILRLANLTYKVEKN